MTIAPIVLRSLIFDMVKTIDIWHGIYFSGKPIKLGWRYSNEEQNTIDKIMKGYKRIVNKPGTLSAEEKVSIFKKTCSPKHFGGQERLKSIFCEQPSRNGLDEFKLFCEEHAKKEREKEIEQKRLEKIENERRKRNFLAEMLRAEDGELLKNIGEMRILLRQWDTWDVEVRTKCSSETEECYDCIGPDCENFHKQEEYEQYLVFKHERWV
jgi:hypothetical protein